MNQKSPERWLARIQRQKESLLKLCLLLFSIGYVLSYCSGVGESAAYQVITFLLLLFGCIFAII